MTPAFSINSIQNAMLSVRFPGSFAHTNIVPLPFGFSQPMDASPVSYPHLQIFPLKDHASLAGNHD